MDLTSEERNEEECVLDRTAMLVHAWHWHDGYASITASTARADVGGVRVAFLDGPPMGICLHSVPPCGRTTHGNLRSGCSTMNFLLFTLLIFASVCVRDGQVRY